MLKDLQRHPSKPYILHIDLQRISESEKLTMRVPLHFIKEDKCIGVKQDGGVISHLMTEIEINCLPKDLPEFINIDMAEVNLGDTIHLGDLVLPEGVESYILARGGDTATTVVPVHLPKAVIEEEEALAEEEGAILGAVAEATEQGGVKDTQESEDTAGKE